MKTVFISGSFNVIHPGHLRLLKFAKEKGDKLIVGILSDKLAGIAAYVPENLRIESLKNNLLVDEVILIDKSIKNTIEKLKPDLIVKGKEFETKFNEELEIIKKYGGELIFSSGEVAFSSLDLIRREIDDLKKLNINLPKEYLLRHSVMKRDLLKIVYKFKSLNVCVIGDLILDKYIYCQPLGMSQEDHSIVVTPVDDNDYIGGAAIVASHASTLGAKVNFLSVGGNDNTANTLDKKIQKYGVKSFILRDFERPTTIKERYISNGRSIFRVSKLYQGAISQIQQKKLLEKFQSVSNKCDLLIFSDFNYGCLPQSLVKKIIDICKKRKIIVTADSQSSSQIGDIARYKTVDLITPTENEARVSTKNNDDGLVIMCENLRNLSKAKNIILKLGEEGILIHSHKKNNDFENDRIQALNLNARNISGAGDSLLVASSMTLATKSNIWQSAFLGSLCAAIQVGRFGNVPIKEKELISEIEKL